MSAHDIMGQRQPERNNNAIGRRDVGSTQSVKPWPSYNLTQVTIEMALENILSRMGLDNKHINERYAEYPTSVHDQQLFYTYEPSAPVHGHTVTTKHHYTSSSHKGNAAMSALTLLAFLFFLHILQQCLKDHMTALSTPQLMIMSAGKEGEQNVAKLSRNKIDKTGPTQNDENAPRSDTINVKDKDNIRDKPLHEEREFDRQTDAEISSSENLFKIKVAEHRPRNNPQRYKIIKNHGNHSTAFTNLYDVINNDNDPPYY